MSTQLRDTHFGHLIRLVSRRRLLRYPDEIDPSLWKSATQRRADSTRDQKDSRDVAVMGDDGEEVYLVGWYGPDDPENPKNWSSASKLLIVGQICLMNFAFYIGSSIYTPGLPSIMEEFNVSSVVATLGLSLYSLGYGTGPMLWSPLSEVPRIGRSRIYLWTLLAFVLLQLPTGYAVNMPMFLVFRYLCGFAGSPALTTGGASIIDVYSPTQAAYGIAVYGWCGICGPVFGPILGGFSARAEGWRITIWIIAWLGAFTLVVVFFLMPETSAATILYRRAKRMRQATGEQRLRSQSEIDAAKYTAKDHLVVLGRAFTLTFSEPVVFSLDLYTALLYGVLFTWFESFPLVFGEIYHFDIGQQGLVFLGIFAGSVITLPVFMLWIKLGFVVRFAKPGFNPEMILPPVFVGAFSLPVCLFWYGWSARASVHWIVPIMGSSVFAIGIITLFNPVLNYLGIVYPTYAASIFAGNGLFRASFGAIFPLFARALFTRLGVGPGNSLLGAISICFIPLPFIFYKYGERIRHMSKNARHDI